MIGRENRAANNVNRFGLPGKVALVTGAAGGLGTAVCMGLAEHGVSIALADVDVESTRQLKDTIIAAGGSACACECDVTKAEAVDRMVRYTLEQFGKIDILVNLAFSFKLNPILEMPAEDFQKTLDVCLTGTFLVTQAVGRVMMKQGIGGSIILFSSISGCRALGRGTGAYAASKAGINALVRELAVEWAPRGVRVNAIAPCQIKTRPLLRLLEDHRKKGDTGLEDRMISNIPVGRLGIPEDVVGPCLFLASEASRMVVGHILYVDGGYTAK